MMSGGWERTGVSADDGFTLIELLIVIVILGVLASVVVFAVSGVTTRGESSVCVTDERTLATAVEAYFGSKETTTLAATGAGHDQYEQTLVGGGFLRGVSASWDLDSTGELVPEAGSGC